MRTSGLKVHEVKFAEQLHLRREFLLQLRGRVPRRATSRILSPRARALVLYPVVQRSRGSVSKARPRELIPPERREREKGVARVGRGEDHERRRRGLGHCERGGRSSPSFSRYASVERRHFNLRSPSTNSISTVAGARLSLSRISPRSDSYCREDEEERATDGRYLSEGNGRNRDRRAAFGSRCAANDLIDSVGSRVADVTLRSGLDLFGFLAILPETLFSPCGIDKR